MASATAAAELVAVHADSPAAPGVSVVGGGLRAELAAESISMLAVMVFVDTTVSSSYCCTDVTKFPTRLSFACLGMESLPSD